MAIFLLCIIICFGNAFSAPLFNDATRAVTFLDNLVKKAEFVKNASEVLLSTNDKIEKIAQNISLIATTGVLPQEDEAILHDMSSDLNILLWIMVGALVLYVAKASIDGLKLYFGKCTAEAHIKKQVDLELKCLNCRRSSVETNDTNHEESCLAEQRNAPDAEQNAEMKTQQNGSSNQRRISSTFKRFFSRQISAPNDNGEVAVNAECAPQK